MTYLKCKRCYNPMVEEKLGKGLLVCSNGACSYQERIRIDSKAPLADKVAKYDK